MHPVKWNIQNDGFLRAILFVVLYLVIVDSLALYIFTTEHIFILQKCLLVKESIERTEILYI